MGEGEPAGTAGPDGSDVVRLGRPAVAWRVALAGVLAALFVTGALVGDDPWWPFGPWRMFSTSTPPSGAVVYMSIEIRTADGTGGSPRATADGWLPAPITLQSVGLNRAEVEGRIPQITRDPAMLGTLAASHHRLRPRDAAWTAVRVVRNEAVIVDRRPTGEVRHVVIATWQAPS